MNTLPNIRFFAVSDIGRRRKYNEDSYAVYDSSAVGPGLNKMGYLFGVADGIGGHACGDVASKMACRELGSFFSAASGEWTPEKCSKRMETLILAIDSLVRRRAAEDPACADMGTTLSALLVWGGFGIAGHVGDSRIYRLRGHRLRQLTTDHTFVQEMIEEGELTEDAAADHPLRSVLTRAVGTPEPLETPEIKLLEIKPGDRFLLASDGLHDMVAFADIKIILTRPGGPQTSAQDLLTAALKNGGKDNVTVIVVDI
jgi:protein phosphatase